uniref:AIG1-type G domain-containing protein n=1 Tax=Tetradesmus obliquus TaxID=3088 RepID=A0A383VJT0_TETOB|eukprot:jgi/Sobl393_1/8250/SZX65203.1
MALHGPRGPRLVLLGTTGSGKSTSGNYLIGSSHDVFRVQHTMNSCTHDIQVATSVLYNWCVVDTPGMGDVPVRQYGQSDEAYDEECKQRRVQFFTQVTGQLRDHGGMVVYVLEHGRLTPEKQRHLKAVNLVLHRCFTSSVVLLLTNVPDMADIEYRMQRSDVVTVRDVLGDPRHLAAVKYMHWLSDARAEVERHCGLRFAAVLGACKPSASADHPAHPKHLPGQMLSLLSAAGSRQPVVGLDRGVAMSWTDIVIGHWNAAMFSETQNKAINQTMASIKSTDANLRWLSQQIEACKATARVGMVAGVAIGAALAFLGPLAAVGPAAGATAAGTAAIFRMCYKNAQGEAVKTLDRLREDLRQQRAELGQLAGQTPEQLKRRAEEIERLVYG